MNPNAPISPKAGFVPAPASFKRSVRTLTVLLAIVALVVVALFAIPIPHHYSFGVTEQPTPGGWLGEVNRSFPIGSYVSGDWSTSSGELTQIQIVAPDLSVVYLGMGPSGQFAFTGQYSSYRFVTSTHANATVSVVGTYSVPIL